MPPLELIDPLEDRSQALEELQQQPDEVLSSQVLHLNFLAVAMMSRRACFLRTESIIPRGSE